MSESNTVGKLEYYCDAPIAVNDDGKVTAWCEWRGTDPACHDRNEDARIDSWVCPKCGWEWVCYLDPEPGWWSA